MQEESKWDLEETIRQSEQKFTTDLESIAKETTKDEKLLKTLVCLERRTLEQKPEEKNHTTNNCQQDSACYFMTTELLF